MLDNFGGDVLTKQLDIKKKQQQLAKQLKNVCSKTGRPREKDVVAVVRSAVRKAWMRSPTKLSLLAKSAVHVYDVPKHLLPKRLSKNTKWLYKCNIEGTYHIGSDVEVDHIKGEHSLKSYDDMVGFTKSILDVGWGDLQILSKEAHACLTYAERYGLTYDEARIQKAALDIIKEKRDVEWIKQQGVTPASNAQKRRQQIAELIGGSCGSK